jgi:hypothetical protein
VSQAPRCSAAKSARSTSPSPSRSAGAQPGPMLTTLVRESLLAPGSAGIPSRERSRIARSLPRRAWTCPLLPRRARTAPAPGSDLPSDPPLAGASASDRALTGAPRSDCSLRFRQPPANLRPAAPVRPACAPRREFAVNTSLAAASIRRQPQEGHAMSSSPYHQCRESSRRRDTRL